MGVEFQLDLQLCFLGDAYFWFHCRSPGFCRFLCRHKYSCHRFFCVDQRCYFFTMVYSFLCSVSVARFSFGVLWARIASCQHIICITDRDVMVGYRYTFSSNSLYSSFFTYLSRTFGHKHSGKLMGLGFVMSALFSLLQVWLFWFLRLAHVRFVFPFLVEAASPIINFTLCFLEPFQPIPNQQCVTYRNQPSLDTINRS